MGFTLRQATLDDRDFLYDLGPATMREYVEQTWGAWNDALYDEQFEATFNLALDQIIMIDGQKAGTVRVEHFPDCDYIGRIYILPTYQNQGIGTAIIQELIAKSHQQGRPLELRVLKSNPRAQQLYERLGFRVYVSIEHHHMMRCSPPESQDSS